MDFPFLTLITFTPAVGAVLLLMLPKDRKTEARMLAAATAFITMVLCLWVFFTYDRSGEQFQFVEQVAWIPMALL